MTIKVHGPIHPVTAVAVSGGVDSMAALSFIGRRRNCTINVAFFDHGTETSRQAKEFVTDYCDNNHLRLLLGEVNGTKAKDQSWEEWWREQRYSFLFSIKTGLVATAHHLDDVAETYLMACFRGRQRFIRYQLKNVVRPFILTRKSDLIDWATRYDVPFIEDKTNEDVKFDRNRVRHNILPEVNAMYPGFYTTVKKKWLENNA